MAIQTERGLELAGVILGTTAASGDSTYGSFQMFRSMHRHARPRTICYSLSAQTWSPSTRPVHTPAWQRKQRVCLRRTASSCFSCPVCGDLVARLCAARKHCMTGHEQAEALARSLVTCPLRVFCVFHVSCLTRGCDDHDGDTSGVGVPLVGCPGGLVCFDKSVCLVMSRLAA